MKPKVLIIRTAGTNCDKETEFAFRLAGADTRLEHINYLLCKGELADFQIICIPGGFSYGDDLGAGKILSLELISWLRDRLGKFLERGGLILGVCNGFQVLVKTGILPDLDFQQKVTLTFNDSDRFEDRWVYLKVETGNVWLKGLPPIISLPIAHGEGRFYAEEDILNRIENNNQIALRYVDSSGGKGDYPVNPNGSVNSIAALTDSSGKVLGLMPHPERFIFKHHLPSWKDEEVFAWGLNFFDNAVNYFK